MSRRWIAVIAALTGVLGVAYLQWGALTPCGILKVKARDWLRDRETSGSDVAGALGMAILGPQIDAMTPLECVDRLLSGRLNDCRHRKLQTPQLPRQRLHFDGDAAHDLLQADSANQQRVSPSCRRVSIRSCTART